MRLRVLIVGLLVALLASLAVQAGAEPAPGLGAATADLRPLDLAVNGPVVQAASLGALLAQAGTDPALPTGTDATNPFAQATLSLPGGQGLQARSDVAAGQQGAAVPLPGGLGLLTLGELSAIVDEAGARGRVSAVSGTLALPVLDAVVRGVGTTADVTHLQARGADGLVVEGIALGVGDLIPAEILAQLPLDLLLDLLDQLPLPELDLGPLLNTLRDTVDLAAAADQLHAGIDAAQEQLDVLAAQLAPARDALAPAQAAADQAEAAAASAEAALQPARDGVTAAQAALAGAACPGPGPAPNPLCVTLEGAQSALAAAESDAATARAAARQARQDLTDAQALVDRLEVAVDAVQADLDVLVDRLDQTLDELLDLVDLLAGLDLAQLVRDLIAGIAGGEILAIDELSIGLTAAANSAASRATAVCDAEGVRVLGADVGDIDTCSDLVDVLAQVRLAIVDVLDVLPVVGGVLSTSLVAVGGLQISTTENDATDGGAFVARADITPLVIAIPSLTLEQATSRIVDLLTGAVDDLLAEVETLTGVDVDLAVLQAALDTLQAQIAALPTGALLVGVATPGLQLSALAAGAGARFRGATAQATPSPTGATEVGGVTITASPTPTPTPQASTAPITTAAQPVATGALPATGGGLALALALSATGAGLGSIARRGSGRNRTGRSIR